METIWHTLIGCGFVSSPDFYETDPGTPLSDLPCGQGESRIASNDTEDNTPKCQGTGECDEGNHGSNASTAPVSAKRGQDAHGLTPADSPEGTEAWAHIKCPPKRDLAKQASLESSDQTTMRSIMKKFVANPRVKEEDMTLLNAIAHLLSTETNRLVFVNPEK